MYSSLPSYSKMLVFVIKLSILIFVFSEKAHIVYADNDSLTSALQYLENIQNRIPNDDDFFRICENNKRKLSVEEQDKIFMKIIQLNDSPQINPPNLLSLYKFKRDAIQSAKISYSEMIDMKDSSSAKTNNMAISYTFAFSKDNRMYLERKGKRWSDDFNNSIISSDGELIKIVSSSEDDIPNAELFKINSMKFFFEPYMPLFHAMLFDTKRCDYPIGVAGGDILEFLNTPGVYVYKQNETVNGRDCILVSNGTQRFYLDTQRDFSIIKIEQYITSNKPNEENSNVSESPIAGRTLIFKSDHFDHVDLGNGIWMPSKIECSFFSNEKLEAFTTIKTNNIEINKKIQDSFFSDVIPDNAIVTDGINNIIYNWGDHPSIGGLLNDTVQRKTVTIFRWISVIIGLAMIAVGVGFKIRKRMKERKAS